MPTSNLGIVIFITMEYDEIKLGVDKLMNSLGKRMAKEIYNLDLNFEMVALIKKSSNYLNDYILLKSEEDIPNIIRVNGGEWGEGRFATITELQQHLTHFLRYIGVPKMGILLNPEQLRYYQTPSLNETDYIDHPERFIPIMNTQQTETKSEDTYVMEKTTGNCYSLKDNKFIDPNSSFNIAEDYIADDLTEKDKINIDRLYK